MFATNRFNRRRRTAKQSRVSHTHLIVDRLEDRLLLSSNPALPFDAPTPPPVDGAPVYQPAYEALNLGGSNAPDFSSTGAHPFYPSGLRGAYGFDRISGDGTGQTIAIIDAYDNPKFVNSTDASFLNSDREHSGFVGGNWPGKIPSSRR